MLYRRLLYLTKAVFKRLPSQNNSVDRTCRLCLSSHTSTVEVNHMDLLKELTGCSNDEIQKYLRKYEGIEGMTEEQLEQGWKMLTDMGIHATNPLEYLCLIKSHMVTTKNRTMTLQEAGFIPSKMTPKIVEKYLLYSKLSISLLKKKKLLERDANVLDHMASYIDIPEDCKPEPPSEEECITNVKRNLLKIYLKWKLDLDDEIMHNDGRLMYRLQHKSLREMMRNIQIAEKRMGIHGPRLKKNWYLLYADADNSVEILEKVPYISGISIKDIVHTRPKIITCSVQNIIKIKHYLQEFGIPGEGLMKRPEVLTLTSETVFNRLKELSNNKFFKLCVRHPRFLDLVYYHKKAVARLKLLEEIKLHYGSLNSIAAADSVFNKFYEMGMERPRGIEIQYYLSSELGVSRTWVRDTLRKHPFWAYIPLVQVATCLSALFDQGFTADQIIQDIHIILYPRERVMSVLQSLEEKGLEVESCRGKDGKLRNELLLKLILYYLEKEVNFTGEAVWGESGNQSSEALHWPMGCVALHRGIRSQGVSNPLQDKVEEGAMEHTTL